MSRITRIQGADLVKGICILLVVLTHAVDFSVFPRPVSAVLDAVMLKGFFSVSGYIMWGAAELSNGIQLKEKLGRKLISLIIPYVGFSVLTVIWHMVLCVGLGCTEVSGSYFGWELILRDIFCMVSGIGIGTLWFLPVLFAAYALLLLTLYATRKGKRFRYVFLWISALLFALVSNVLADMEVKKLGSGLIVKVVSEYTNTLHRICYGYAYMALGYLLRGIYEKCAKCSRICALLLGLCIAAIMAYQSQLMMLFELTACALLLTASIALLQERDDMNNSNIYIYIYKCVRPILFCGRNSMAIMVIHYQFLWPLERMVLRSMGLENHAWLFFAVNISTTLFVVWMLRKNNIMNWLLSGKRAVRSA